GRIELVAILPVVDERKLVVVVRCETDLRADHGILALGILASAAVLGRNGLEVVRRTIALRLGVRAGDIRIPAIVLAADRDSRTLVVTVEAIVHLRREACACLERLCGLATHYVYRSHENVWTVEQRREAF